MTDYYFGVAICIQIQIPVKIWHWAGDGLVLAYGGQGLHINGLMPYVTWHGTSLTNLAHQFE